MRKHIYSLCLILLCLLSAGCLRIADNAFGHAMSPGVYHSYAGDTYFYGTQLVGQCLTQPFAPLAILDFPFELVIDLIILPVQLIDAQGISERRRQRAAQMSPVYLVRDGWMKEFKNHLPTMDSWSRSYLAKELVYSESVSVGERKTCKYLKVLCEYDSGCLERLLNSDICLRFRHYKIYEYLFRHGFSVKDVSCENAVFFAVVSSYGHCILQEYKMARLLLQNGCNPNAAPPYMTTETHGKVSNTPLESEWKEFWRWYGKYKDMTPLDIAISHLEQMKEENKESRNNKYDTLEMNNAEELVRLLRRFGAKTADELKEEEKNGIVTH